jgi:hypothetical protein
VKWYSTIDDTFGNNVTCDFSSDCFISDGESVFERQEYVKTACDLLFTIDDYIRCGENRCEVRIRKLEAEGLMNKQYSFLDNGQQPFLGQEFNQHPLWYEVFFARDLTETIIVNADLFGNVCGYCTIPFKYTDFKCPEKGKKRIVQGDLRLCLFGTADNIKVEAHMNVFDMTGKDVDCIPVESDDNK